MNTFIAIVNGQFNENVIKRNEFIFVRMLKTVDTNVYFDKNEIDFIFSTTSERCTFFIKSKISFEISIE